MVVIAQSAPATTVDASGQLAMLVAEAAIEGRTCGLAMALAAGDRAAAVAAYARQAICVHGKRETNAARFVDEQMSGRCNLVFRGGHQTGHLSAVSGETASAETYVIMPSDAAASGLCGGRLLHRLALIDGDWLITRQEFVIDWGFAWPNTDMETRN